MCTINKSAHTKKSGNLFNDLVTERVKGGWHHDKSYRD